MLDSLPIDLRLQLEGLPSDAMRREAAALLGERLEYLRRLQVEAPLTIARLWTHPAAECDQRTQVIEGMRGPLVVAMGGNRSGKTYGALEADVAVALGRYHPHTRAWCRLNDIPPDLIPVGPGEVVVLSATAQQSQSQTRPAIDRLLPGGAEWYGLRGLAPAHVRINVPGHHEQAVIRFGSVDQGPKAHKGSQARRYHIDEEPEGPDGLGVLQECLRGASAIGGHVVITATPQAGLTWMIERLVQGGEYGARTLLINSLHNRFAPNYAGLRAWLESLPAEERRMREQGVWYDRRGLIYTGWSRPLHYRESIKVGGHVVTADSIPGHWRRYRGIDFGQTNPTAIVWLAVDPESGTIVVYRCATQPRVPYEEWADRIHEAEGAVKTEAGRWVDHVERVEMGWHDPSDPSAAETLTLCGVVTTPADRRVEAGISTVADAMRPDMAGRPGIVVLHGEGTADLVREIEGYRYDPDSKTNKVLKVRDHLCDALRYAVMGCYRLEGLAGQTAKRPTTEEGEND